MFGQSNNTRSIVVAFSFLAVTSTILGANAFQLFKGPLPTKQMIPSTAPSFVPFGHRTMALVETDSVTTTTRRSDTTTKDQEANQAEAIRQDWINNSVQYYSKVMREERRRSNGQFKEMSDPHYYTILAKKHYFALRKIKDGKPEQAELIYRRIINELLAEQQNDNDEEHCDHSKLAVTTLLLALHLQRNEASPKKTRSVFLNFFRIVTSENDQHEECACSAKVLQAFALFEMKQGNSQKSLELVLAAIQLDPTLKPVLNWKQFRDAMQRRRKQLTNRQLRP